jgi:glycosyltransferase involved in cell wall biosynthesis
MNITTQYESNQPDSLPLISIALCVYNGERYLSQQLNTLVIQTYPHIEIVAVDDCSNDRSREILKDFSARYSFIRVYENQSNLGYVKNFERALRLCTGEFVALSDQDDLWHPDKLRRQFERIEGHRLIYHDSRFIDENGQNLQKKMSDVINLYSGNSPEVLLFFNCVSGHTCFFRRSLLAEILPFPEGHFHDHWIAWVAANLGTIDFIDDCLVDYRQHTTSSTDILNKRKKLNKSYHENRDVIKLQKELNWLKQCTSYAKNKNALFLRELTGLFERRISDFFSFRYANFVRRHFDTLFFVQKQRKSKKNAFIYRQVWGLKAKVLWGKLFG